jgi:hypothetical protein
MSHASQPVGNVAENFSRRHFIGGSDARIIMGKDEAALLRLWREKRGEVEPEDLSANLIVQLGLVTEPLIRTWYERDTGPECSTQCAQCLFAFFGCGKLPEAHARPSSILVDEFDPGASQHCFNRRERCRITGISADLKIGDRVPMQAGRFREVSHGPIESRPSHPNLCTCHSHRVVLLSHVLTTQ